MQDLGYLRGSSAALGEWPLVASDVDAGAKYHLAGEFYTGTPAGETVQAACMTAYDKSCLLSMRLKRPDGRIGGCSPVKTSSV